MNACALTDVGKVRNVNQDCVYYSLEKVGILPNLFIVADGMGGENAGDVASHFTIEHLLKFIKSSDIIDTITLMQEAIKDVNHALVKKAAESADTIGMGTTLVLATIIDGMLIVANVGDSRLYVLQNNLIQITRDHSYVEELVEIGEIDRSQARTHDRKNLITRAIGGENEVKPEFFTVELKSSDTVLMCSDGLTNMVEDDEISAIIRYTSDVNVTAKKLIDTANANGGKDNISVVLIRLNER